MNKKVAETIVLKVASKLIMKVAKIFVVLALLLVFALNVLCQSAKQSKNATKYPNELKGFELMKTSKLKILVPGVSTAEEIKTFYEGCKNQHKRIGACELDKDWYYSLSQIGTLDGMLNSIEFYPRKRIPFLKVRFSKKFKKSEWGIVHVIDASKFKVYEDDYGLSYWIVNESGDAEYMKGDLFFVKYSFPKVIK